MDSNVLAAIARGVPFNALQDFQTGLDAGRKRAEQNRLREAQIRAGNALGAGNYNEALNALVQSGDAPAAVGIVKAMQPDVPNSVSEFNLARQNPAYMKFLIERAQAGNPYMIIPPGGQAVPKAGGPGAGGAPIQGPPLRPTTENLKDASLYDRAKAADTILSDPGSIEAASSLGQRIKGAVPYVGNYLTSPQYQQFDQAQRDFVNAVLRQESGAAINESEFQNARVQYFPQPGDSEAVVKQKAENRRIKIEGLQRSSGPALTSQPAPNGGGNAGLDDLRANPPTPEEIHAFAQKNGMSDADAANLVNEQLRQ